MRNVGDKVTIRPDLDIEVESKTCIVKTGMLQYAGKEATVVSIDRDGDATIDIDNGDWFWSEEFLVPEEETKTE